MFTNSKFIRLVSLVSSILLLSNPASSAPTRGTTLAVRQAPAYDPTACNNHPSLCTRKYSEVYHLGAHDSPFLRNTRNGFSIAGNQFLNVRAQLDAGVRLLQGQIHKEDTQLAPRLCHSDCRMMDGGSLDDYLTEVKSWMDEHPSEVVTMLWVNADNIPASILSAHFQTTGTADIAFNPPQIPMPRDAWPTLGEMISTKKRLVIFISTSADQVAVPWLLDEFSHMFETNFENFDPAKFNCNSHRPRIVEDPTALAELAGTKMGFMNRFLYQEIFEQFGVELFIPDPTQSAKINSGDSAVAGNLKDGVSACTAAWGGNRGGFVLLDFFNEGTPIAVIDNANGFSDPVNRVAPPVRNEDGIFTPEELTFGTNSAGEMSAVFDMIHDVFEPGTPIEVIDDVIDGGEDTVEGGKEIVEEGKDIVEDVVEEGKEVVEDVIDEGKEVIEDIKDFLPFSISSSRAGVDSVKSGNVRTIGTAKKTRKARRAVGRK